MNSTDTRRMTRFGPGTVAFITIILALGVILSYFGFTRMQANLEGGGTFFILGIGFLLATVFISVGIATTRIDRVNKKYHSLPSLIGKRGIVKSGIAKGGRGVVLVDNELWTATSEEQLEEGARVKIINIQGLTLSVSKEVQD